MIYVGPTIFALFLWWFTTGVIFYLDSRAPHTFKWSMIFGTVMLGLALAMLSAQANATDEQGAYLAFTAGLLAWGWQELSLYTGFVTGPRKIRCAEGCSGIKHFGHAIAANLWHEIAIVVVAAVIWFLVKDGTNKIGFFTYLILWAMHLSARLNVFLGVRNVSVEFVPPHMDVLKSFLSQRPMNMLFPLSITLATTGTIFLIGKTMDAAPGFETVGLTLLSAIMGLALVEHWFLVLPIPFDRLWRWSLPQSRHTPVPPPAADRPDEFSALPPPLTHSPDSPCCRGLVNGI